MKQFNMSGVNTLRRRKRRRRRRREKKKTLTYKSKRDEYKTDKNKSYERQRGSGRED